jgi:hypothetical protein
MAIPRQPLLQADRIDQEDVGPIEAADADVIIERTHPRDRQVAGHGRGVRAAAEQVDLDEMSLAREDLAPLGQVRIPARVTQGLVGRAQDFDRGNQPYLRTVSAADLNERLDVWIMLDRLDGDGDRFIEVDLLYNRDASAILIAPRGLPAGMNHVDVGLDVPMRNLKPDPLRSLGIVRLGQP